MKPLTPPPLPSPSTIQPGDVIAVGDVHACYDLLSKFLEFVQGSQACVILLGDIIDRGGDDVKVLNVVSSLLKEPEAIGLSNFFCLMGNHEAMFIDAVTGPGPDWVLWLQNGGNFDDYGEMQEHLDWLEDLPIFMTVGDTMFMHAGFFPGKDPTETINSGGTESLLWMRHPFLTYGPEFEKWNPSLKKVVFGHSPRNDGAPYEIPGGGICIDSGAFFSDKLTAYNVTQDTLYQFTK